MALEPSHGMVDQAKRNNIYKEFIIEIMGVEPSSIEEGECKPHNETSLHKPSNHQENMFAQNMWVLQMG